jgi:hypothetical protein
MLKIICYYSIMDVKTLKTTELTSKTFMLDGYREHDAWLLEAMVKTEDYEERKRIILERIALAKAMYKVSSRIEELKKAVDGL